MSERARELQQSLFGDLHDFHVGRTGIWIDAAREALGDEVLDVVRDGGVDPYGLYRWHIERSLRMLDALQARYGERAIRIVQERQTSDRHAQGAAIAQALGRNALDDILPCFTHGDDANIVERSDTEALVRATGCLAGRIAHDIGREDLVYSLHCATDPAFTEGFNDRLGCEVVQTLMDGHSCCLHRIFVKPVEATGASIDGA